MSETIYQQLVRHEGIRLKPYRCTAGRLTIGVGRNLDDKGITNGEAMVLLHNDVDEVAKWLRVDYEWFDKLSLTRRNVLINMGFNLGRGGLSRFKNMLDAIKSRQWDRAANEMLDSQWANQVGSRARELADQMRQG